MEKGIKLSERRRSRFLLKLEIFNGIKEPGFYKTQRVFDPAMETCGSRESVAGWVLLLLFLPIKKSKMRNTDITFDVSQNSLQASRQ
jgi:hypothetical protein